MQMNAGAHLWNVVAAAVQAEVHREEMFDRQLVDPLHMKSAAGVRFNDRRKSRSAARI